MDFPDDPAALLNNGQFTDGDPQQGLEASRILASWMNAVTNELINFITTSGQTPNTANVSQLTTAIQNYFNLLDAANANNLGNNPPEYYRDASNLNAGLLSGARFNDASHGIRSGGNLHNLVTQTVAGFMRYQDKVKLDGIDASNLTVTSTMISYVCSVTGLIVQGGFIGPNTVIYNNSDFAFTFLTAFPTQCRALLVSPYYSGDSSANSMYPTVRSKTTTGGTIALYGSGGNQWGGLNFLAIGN